MSKTIGVIGLGSIGSRHAKNLTDMGHKVIGYDPAPIFSRMTGNDLNAIIRDSDAVVIASPTSEHYDHVLDCVGEGKGHKIFCEKPIADRTTYGFDGVTGGTAEFMGFVAMVGYNLRFHSCVKKAKEWLDAGLIGEPLWANFTVGQYNDKPAYLRDGVILNWSHEIDLALYLLGGGSVAGSSTRLSDGHDDMTDILLTHEKGCQTSVHLDYLTHPEERHFEIHSKYGSIKCNLVTRKATYCNSDGFPIDEFTGADTFDENYIEEMQAFIDRIDGKETLGATGAEGLAVLDICLEVRKQAGLDPDAYKHIALGICRKCRKLHYSNEVCS